MENKRILVIGGTGYIGTSLVDKLIENDYEVSLLIRQNLAYTYIEKCEKCQLYKNQLGLSKINCNRLNTIKYCNKLCKCFIGDLLDKQSLENIQIDNFDMVINLASIIRTTDKKRYTENIVGLKNLIDVMENSKKTNNKNDTNNKNETNKKIIYFSTQNVNLKNKGYYSKSKEECENLLKKSTLDYIIIRPNYVYGIDKNNDFYKMGHYIKYYHIVPIIGSGNYKRQPVLKDDLVNITLRFINNFKKGKIVEISGDTTISMNEIIELIREDLKINVFRLYVPIKLLKIFERFIPFDVGGFTEDRISSSPFEYQFSSFTDNLKKIVNLL